MARFPGNPLKLGVIDGKREFLGMSPEMRSTHLYITGSTGTGKSKMLENLVRQDIANWFKSKCGLLLLDPHGSLYDGLTSWMASYDDVLKGVPIVPIDLRQRGWTIGYNVMRARKEADPAVVISNFVQAMAYVWGVSGTDKTPLFARVASNVLWALYENKLTLLESEHLIDRVTKHIRSEITQNLSKRAVAQDWAFLNTLSPRDFDTQVSSTLNRFYSFLHNEKLRLMFGQNGASLDLGTALEKGSIILVNLSGEGARISEEDASLFATLLLSDLWTAAKERGKGTDAHQVKPFYVYCDEFQNFITPTIAKNLDQARGFGLHLILANQFPRQILHSGAHGEQVYDSVMGNAKSKVVFETRGEENLRPLANELFMGVMNPDEIKYELYSTKVTRYDEETRTAHARADSKSEGIGQSARATGLENMGDIGISTLPLEPWSWNQPPADSLGSSRMDVKGSSESESEFSVFVPVFEKELAARQFRPLEEQIFRAMVALHDQKQRHCVARLTGMSMPLAIQTPTVLRSLTDSKGTRSFLSKVYKRLPFASKTELPRQHIMERETSLSNGGIGFEEPTEIWRTIA